MREREAWGEPVLIDVTSDWCLGRRIKVIRGFKEQSGSVACVAKGLEENGDNQSVRIKMICCVAGHI